METLSLVELHHQVESTWFQLKYWPVTGLLLLCFLNVYLNGKWQRIAWSAVFVFFDIAFLLVMLPQLTARFGLLSALALNWTYVGISWYLSSALTVLFCLMLLPAGLLVKDFRRRFLNARWFFGSFLFAVVIVGITVLWGCGHYEVVFEKIALKDYQGQIRLAFMADAHLGFDDNVEKFAGVCDKIIDSGCHAALFGGDLADDIEMRAGAVAQLARLSRALPGGVYFVSGNGDHTDGNWPVTRSLLLKSGIKLLENRTVNIGTARTPLLLAGVDYAALNDDNAFDAVKQQRYVREPFKNVPRDIPLILLAHTPEVHNMLQGSRADLQLYGHTHGGQVYLFGRRFMERDYRLISGEYRNAAEQIIVTNGIGQWFPVRINVPQQLHIILIEGADKNRKI